VGYRDERLVEYDIDTEDERWLEQFNGGQERLSQRRFEQMIYRLELANAEATDRALAAAGGGAHRALQPFRVYVAVGFVSVLATRQKWGLAGCFRRGPFPPKCHHWK
jgi:Enhancer of polycomb-like